MAEIPAEFTGVDLEVIALELATVIKATGKFTNSEHGQAVQAILKRGGPSVAANITRISNVSQVRQELERAGVIEGSKTALAVATAKAMAALKAKK